MQERKKIQGKLYYHGTVEIFHFFKLSYEEKDNDKDSFLQKIKEEAEKELEDLKTQHQAELEICK